MLLDTIYLGTKLYRWDGDTKGWRDCKKVRVGKDRYGRHGLEYDDCFYHDKKTGWIVIQNYNTLRI